MSRESPRASTGKNTEPNAFVEVKVENDKQKTLEKAKRSTIVGEVYISDDNGNGSQKRHSPVSLLARDMPKFKLDNKVAVDMPKFILDDNEMQKKVVIALPCKDSTISVEEEVAPKPAIEEGEGSPASVTTAMPRYISEKTKGWTGIIILDDD